MRVRKQLIFTLLFIVLLSPKVLCEELSWKEIKGDHFIVYYLGKDEFATNVMRKAEEYYNTIGNDLGYERRDNFWQWENRVKLYIYPTREQFLSGTAQQDWSHGFANYQKKEIRSYEWKEGFLESLLPHELTHLIFRDYVGFDGEIPVWLDEGVAQWQEPQKKAIVRQVMRQCLAAEQGYTFKDLMTIDIRTVSLASAVELFYIESASIIEFLVSKYGADQFIFFCRQLRDGKIMDEALRFAYPAEIRDVQQMEEKWKDYILGAL